MFLNIKSLKVLCFFSVTLFGVAGCTQSPSLARGQSAISPEDNAKSDDPSEQDTAHNGQESDNKVPKWVVTEVKSVPENIPLDCLASEIPMNKRFPNQILLNDLHLFKFPHPLSHLKHSSGGAERRLSLRRSKDTKLSELAYRRSET